jgi:hypothetical protein
MARILLSQPWQTYLLDSFSFLCYPSSLHYCGRHLCFLLLCPKSIGFSNPNLASDSSYDMFFSHSIRTVYHMDGFQEQSGCPCIWSCLCLFGTIKTNWRDWCVCFCKQKYGLGLSRQVHSFSIVFLFLIMSNRRSFQEVDGGSGTDYWCSNYCMFETRVGFPPLSMQDSSEVCYKLLQQNQNTSRWILWMSRVAHPFIQVFRLYSLQISRTMKRVQCSNLFSRLC